MNRLIMICICIILSVTLLFVYPIQISKASDQQLELKSEVYVDWIMKNSSKISRKTAVKIWSTCLETETGLLMLAIAKRESNFNPSAISSAGAVGINQIMPNVWTKTLIEEGIIEESKDLFDYDKNILASNYIILKYYNQTGNWRKALRKYVGGAHKTYIKDVLSIYGELVLLGHNTEQCNTE